MVDYHIHTSYSWDGKSSMEQVISQAVTVGLKEIALTEHIDPEFKDGLPTGGVRWNIDFEKYIVELNLLRDKYAGKIKIVFGVEISVEPVSKAVAEELIGQWPFEFVIGSMHDVGGIDFYYHEAYGAKTKRQAYEEYFMNMKKTVEEVNGFHVLGHMDYIERNLPGQYAPYEDKEIVYEEFAEVIDEVLKAVVHSGKGIEVNTSGANYLLNRAKYDAAHPRFKIIKRYRELGGEIITIGSDAHTLDRAGDNYEKARECLIAAGFKAVTVYRDGKPEFVDL